MISHRPQVHDESKLSIQIRSRHARHLQAAPGEAGGERRKAGGVFAGGNALAGAVGYSHENHGEAEQGEGDVKRL